MHKDDNNRTDAMNLVRSCKPCEKGESRRPTEQRDIPTIEPELLMAFQAFDVPFWSGNKLCHLWTIRGKEDTVQRHRGHKRSVDELIALYAEFEPKGISPFDN